MRTTTTRSRLTLLFMAFAMMVALPATAFADDVANNLDTSIDATHEVMAVDKDKTNTTQLYVDATNGDGKSGCNITGNDKSVTVSLRSSDTNVATVSPSSVTFNNCIDKKLVTVTGVGEGSALIQARLVANSSEGSITVSGVDFRVNVSNPPPANTAPKVSLNGVDGGASYEKGSVPAATCSVVDAEDGNSNFAATLSDTLDANGYGSQTASCTYTDAGGLTETVSVTYSITETQKPTSQHSLSADANADGWHKEDVTVNLSATDNPGGSGVKEIRYSINGGAEQIAAGASKALLVDNEGTTTISYYAVDNFGNAESPANTASVKLDKTAPTIVDMGVSVGPTGSNGWYTSQVTNEFRAADGLSGFSGQTDPHSILKVSGINQEGSSIVLNSGTVTDRAGNVSNSADSAEFKIDLVNPSLNINGPASGNFDVCNIPARPASDPGDTLNGSGVDSSTFLDNWTTPANAFSLGNYVYSASVSDFAGRSANETRTYTVNSYGAAYSGILQPINTAVGSTRSTFKLGSTIPVKFRLTCGLTPITNANAKLSVQKVDSTPNADINEAVSTSAATTGNLFRYDATSSQYIFNLSTKGSFNGSLWSFSEGTWRVLVDLGDGSALKVATFDIKK